MTQPAPAQTRQGSPGPFWRGEAVPPILAMWFDQLTSGTLQPVFQLVERGEVSHMDVTLTVAFGGSARPPQVILK